MQQPQIALDQFIQNQLVHQPIHCIPYPHSTYQNVFPPQLYQQLIDNLPPTEQFTFSNKSYPKRGFIFLGCNQSFQQNYQDTYQRLIRSYNHQDRLIQLTHPSWQRLTTWLLSDETLNFWLRRYWPFIEHRFNREVLKDMKFYQRTTLCRDLPGYAIPPHTDTPRKILTILFYLPRDNSQAKYGTQILIDHQNRNKPPINSPTTTTPTPTTWDSKHQDNWDDFTVHTTAPNEMNSAMDFFVGPESWHGVKTYEGPGQRDTIQMAIYGFTGEPSLG